MTRINWIFCSNLSKIDFHLKYNVVWTNCNVQFDFFGNSNSLNFSLNDSKWWKCKLFIIFLLWGSRYFSIFLNYHSAQPQLKKTCDMVVSTQAVTTKRALSPVVYMSLFHLIDINDEMLPESLCLNYSLKLELFDIYSHGFSKYKGMNNAKSCWGLSNLLWLLWLFISCYKKLSYVIEFI